MDFLREILGEELFNQVAEKINAHNGNEANKDKQIKIGNLGGGEYVGKAKHEALQAQHDSKDQELQKANALIAELQKAAKGDETLQGKITDYQKQVGDLQAQLKQTQIDSGLKIALMEAGGIELDFLIWKAKQGNDGKPLEIGEDGKIKGIDDLISGLKISAPNHFKKAGGVKVDENPLPSGGERKDEPQTLADAIRMQYENK